MPTDSQLKLPFDDAQLKYCAQCRNWKQRDEFYKNRSTRDGLQPSCRTCHRANTREYFFRNHEKCLEDRRRYHQENGEKMRAKMIAYAAAHRDELREYGKEYRAKNADVVRQRKRAYYFANLESEKAKRKAWREANPEKVAEDRKRWGQANRQADKAYKAKSHARRLAAPGSCTAAQWQAKVAYHGWRCLYCQIELNASTLQMEHRKPLSRGGSHFAANLAPACQSCNFRKHTMTEAEFRARLKG